MSWNYRYCSFDNSSEWRKISESLQKWENGITTKKTMMNASRSTCPFSALLLRLSSSQSSLLCAADAAKGNGIAGLSEVSCYSAFPRLLYSWRHFPKLDRIIQLPPEPTKVPPPYQISGNLASAPIYQFSSYQLQPGQVPTAPHAVQGEVIHPPAHQQVFQNHTQQGYNPNFNNV